MSTIIIESTAITHVGLVRANNEDNYFVNGKFKTDGMIAAEGFVDSMYRDSYLYAVYDGMGGDNSGEVASMIAARTLAEYISTDVRDTVYDYIQKANKLICDEVKKNRGIRSGSTLALLYIRENKATSFNIGDSRVYLCRKENLYLLSEDHTENQQLTQHLGVFPNEVILEPYISEEIKIKKNDIFLICSDGLTDMVHDDDIIDIMVRKDLDTSGIAKELSATAQEHGGRDNSTVIVVKILSA